jgi:peptidoglycan/LPS O-acetylase OafA/YrhL
MAINYRPEIDGLRAIAVLSVIIYHAEFVAGGTKVLSGGFLGVDIFFVISGFLITSLMMKEYKSTGTISISDFYQRRARRLLPALLVVMLASMPFAWKYLLPVQLIDYAQSLLSSLLFSSNFYWNYSLQQYGTESGLLKPMLHTWSLAVEEQYYIVFPLILLAIYKWCKSYMTLLLSLGLLVSLLFAEWMSSQHASFSFYMLPSRIWELLAGGLLANLLHFNPQKNTAALQHRAMPGLGLFLILYSVFFIEFDSSHPGFVTVLPVIGTVLIIRFASKDEWVTKILSNRLFVFVGLISYSLYLWHYPIFAFFRIEGLFENDFGRIIAITLALLISVISVRFLEKPFRSSYIISNRMFIASVLMVSIIIGGLAASVVVNQGYPDRFNGLLAFGAKEMEVYRLKYWGDKSAYTKNKDFSSDKVSVEIIGNSWGQDIANALVEEGMYEIGFKGMTGHYCKAITLSNVGEKHENYKKSLERCPNNIKRFTTPLVNTDLVIIADNLTLLDVQADTISTEILKNISVLKAAGYKGPILIITNRPKYIKAVFSIINDYGFSGEGVNQYAQQYLYRPIGEMMEDDRHAQIFYQQNNIYYYSLVDALCRDERCEISFQGAPLYHDRGHLTMSGAVYVGPQLVEFIENTIFSQQKVVGPQN